MLWGCWHGRGTLTIPFNFLDLEDLDADYERSVEQAIRVASLFQSCANRNALGGHFLSTRSDTHVLFLQQIQFDRQGVVDEASSLRLITEFAVRCRDRVLSEKKAA